MTSPLSKVKASGPSACRVEGVTHLLYESYSRNIGDSTGPAENDRAVKRFVRHSLAPYLPRNRDARILELGCGDGLLLVALKSYGYSDLSGVDISPSQVEKARTAGVDNVQVADVGAALASRTSCYEVILAIDVLEHLPKHVCVECLAKAYAALTPGGCLIARCPNAAALLGNYVQRCDLTHETAFAPRSFAQALRAAGFPGGSFFSCGPIPDNVVGVIRWVLWRFWVAVQRVVWLIDTGTGGPEVLTPNMLCVAKKPA